MPNVQWKTADDGQRTYPKHVEFLDKINLGKLVRLLVLLKRNLLRCTVTCHDARSRVTMHGHMLLCTVTCYDARSHVTMHSHMSRCRSHVTMHGHMLRCTVTCHDAGHMSRCTVTCYDARSHGRKMCFYVFRRICIPLVAARK